MSQGSKPYINAVQIKSSDLNCHSFTSASVTRVWSNPTPSLKCVYVDRSDQTPRRTSESAVTQETIMFKSININLSFEYSTNDRHRWRRFITTFRPIRSTVSTCTIHRLHKMSLCTVCTVCPVILLFCGHFVQDFRFFLFVYLCTCFVFHLPFYLTFLYSLYFCNARKGRTLRLKARSDRRYSCPFHYGMSSIAPFTVWALSQQGVTRTGCSNTTLILSPGWNVANVTLMFNIKPKHQYVKTFVPKPDVVFPGFNHSTVHAVTFPRPPHVPYSQTVFTQCTLTSLAFCFSRACSGSSCLERLCGNQR